MDFKTLKEQTAKDCEQLAETLNKLAAEVREGNTDAFLAFFYEGGTEEGDAKILALRESILMRYFYRREKLNSATKEPPISGEKQQEEKLDNQVVAQQIVESITSAFVGDGDNPPPLSGIGG